MMGYGDMAGYAWIWMTVGLAFWGLLIAFAIHAFGRTAGDREGAPTPEEILRRRYARGEIDAAEYEARRRVIHG
jgi:putative membrane protein